MFIWYNYTIVNFYVVRILKAVIEVNLICSKQLCPANQTGLIIWWTLTPKIG
jgi:hypothetical protein